MWRKSALHWSCLTFGLTVVVLFVVTNAELSGRERPSRRKSTSTTTATPEDIISISNRELNLLKREEAFNSRESSFNEREVNFTLREEKLREREYQLTVREANVAEREKNFDKFGIDTPTTTPKPDLHFVRFDPLSQKYYDIGSTQPCGENMKFFAVPGENLDIGMCDCDYYQCSRPLIYSKEYNQCFWAWSQGPCEQNHWYTFNETFQPMCEVNDCPKTLAHGIAKYYFKDKEDDTCYETTTQGYCELDTERLLTTHEDPLPTCRTHTLCAPTSHPPQQLCIPGSRQYISTAGKCN